MADLYNDGYKAFDANNELPIEYVKQQSYQFRAGYSRAKADFERNKQSYALSFVLYPVSRERKTVNVSYNDIMELTKRSRTAVLHRHPQLYPVVALLVKTIEKNLDKANTYSDVSKMVNKGFDIILQYGYDEGVLNKTDLIKHGYTPIVVDE